MSSLFNSDGSFPLQFAIIFLVIFLILAAGAYALRRITGGRLSLSSKAAQRGRQPRLGIIDIYELDRQRQLILLRRDNVEHLLLVGGPNDVVVERNIVRGAAARAALDDPPRLDPEPTNAAAPADEAPRAPGPLFEPFPPPPAAVSSPSPAMDRTAGRRAEESALFEAVAPAPPRAEPQPARAGSRRSPPPLANLKPEAAPERARSAATVASPEPALIAPLAAAPPNPSAPKPSATNPSAPMPPATMPLSPMPAPVLSAPPRADPPAVAPPSLPSAPPVSNPPPRAIDAAILADMARQLEETLQRPVEEPPPIQGSQPPAAPAPPTERPRHEEPAERPVDPMAAAMAASPQEPAADDLFEEPAPAVKLEPAPPPFMPEPPPPAAADPAPPPPPPKPATQNPFSVEEIEAEFARLLGRPLDRKS